MEKETKTERKKVGKKEKTKKKKEMRKDRKKNKEEGKKQRQEKKMGCFFNHFLNFVLFPCIFA